MGGTTVESPPTIAIPGHADIDNLFAFVQAAQVKKVIYSLRLLETNASAALRRHQRRHRQIHLGTITGPISTVSLSATSPTGEPFMIKTWP